MREQRQGGDGRSVFGAQRDTPITDAQHSSSSYLIFLSQDAATATLSK